jgi:hypothetical protein
MKRSSGLPASGGFARVRRAHKWALHYIVQELNGVKVGWAGQVDEVARPFPLLPQTSNLQPIAIIFSFCRITWAVGNFFYQPFNQTAVINGCHPQF